jgi:hypothetical protein
MAKSSEITRHNMFPALLHNLDNPSPEALPLIAKGKNSKYISIVALFMVSGSHFSIRICLYLERQRIQTPLLYIVSDGDLILPSYLTIRLPVRNGGPDIVVAAIEATTRLLAKGSYFERKKLLDAKVFLVALKLHNRGSQREQSLKLLHSIVLHLGYEILNDDNLAIEMLSLFE